jgi:HK97 family phage prohead protease
MPLEIVAEEKVDESAGESPRRQIAGLAVPYNQAARVGPLGQSVTFQTGSIIAENGSPLLLGHDVQRPVGVLVDASSKDDGVRARWAVDPTRDGDEALVQAQSGSRRGLSVGVDLEEFQEQEDGSLLVQLGRLAETSLVALAGYVGAQVDTVTASDKGEDMPEETQPADEPTTAPVEAHPAPVEAHRPPIIVAERPAPELRAGEFVQLYVQAAKGNVRARQRIEAALTLETTTTEPGVIPIVYVQQIIDSLGADRPLFNAMSKADMPAAGMLIRRPHVTTRPDGNWVLDETTGIPTGPVVIGNQDMPIKQWAWGGSASVALVERSAPSYVEEVFSQAVKSYYRDVEADVAASFPTSASTVTTLGGGFAAFMAAYRTFPNLLVCGGTAYGKLIDARGVALFSGGSADAQGNANIAGLSVVASPDVAATDAWVTARDFLELRETTPIRLSVANVEALSMEIGVTGFFAKLQERETLGGVAGAVRIPTWTPAADPAATAEESGRKRS